MEFFHSLIFVLVIAFILGLFTGYTHFSYTRYPYLDLVANYQSNSQLYFNYIKSNSLKHVYLLYIFKTGVYLICILATSMLSLMVTIVGLRLHHHQPNDPVPHWLKSLLRMMAAVTCQRTSLVALKCSTANIDTHDYHSNKEKYQNENEKTREIKLASHDTNNGNLCKNLEDHSPGVDPNTGSSPGSSTGSSPWSSPRLYLTVFSPYCFFSSSSR